MLEKVKRLNVNLTAIIHETRDIVWLRTHTDPIQWVVIPIGSLHVLLRFLKKEEKKDPNHILDLRFDMWSEEKILLHREERMKKMINEMEERMRRGNEC